MSEVDNVREEAFDDESAGLLGERAALEQALIEPSGTEAAATVDPPPRTLARTTVRGAAVTLGGQGSQLLLQMSLVVVLARLLGPGDYGLYAMVLVISGIGEVFRDFGLSSAAIQARTLSKDQQTNLFWINTGLGAVLAVVLFSAAPVAAALFHEPRLLDVAHLLSITFLINGMTTQFRAGLNRQMRFGALALTDLVAQLVNVTFAITLAAAGAHYWALVGSQIAQVSTVLLMVVYFARWRPGRPKRGVPIAGFLRFGGPFVLTQLVNYASNNVDSLTIGIRFGPVPLGLYNRGYQLLMNPLSQLRQPATTVALPVLSRLRDTPDKANAYLIRGQIVIGYTIVAGLGLACGAAVPLVHLFLGPKWASVSFIFAMLAIAGIFQMMSYLGYWVYLSRGLTSHLLKWTAMAFVLRVTCILVGSLWGIRGVAVGFAVAPAIAWPLSLYWLGRKAPLPVSALYAGAGRILSITGAIGAASWMVCRLLRDQPDIVQLVAAAAAAVAVVAVVAAALPRIRQDVTAIRSVGDYLRRRRAKAPAAAPHRVPRERPNDRRAAV